MKRILDYAVKLTRLRTCGGGRHERLRDVGWTTRT